MTVHPLEPLTGDEIARAVELLRAKEDGVEDTMLIARVVLDEPTKDELGQTVVERRAAITVVPGPGADLIEAVVSLTDEVVTSCVDVHDVRAALLFEESLNAIVAVMENEQWQQAMRKRGVDDFSKVQLDPWPAGRFGVAHETNRRITRVLSYLRDDPTDNGYARPIEGVLVFVDMATAEVLEVQDHGVVPVPSDKGSYFPADNTPARIGLRPLDIVQPDGPSFTVDGHAITWQRWSLRVSMDPYEGLVLHTVGYEDEGRMRPILHRAGVSEMVVPYGDPGLLHGWKNAFDAGEWGLGRMANSLALGCDCLGDIRYLDAVFADEHGKPSTVTNAICIHEEDYGILWKHWDMQANTTEVRRSRRLVVSSIATVGNYEYGFYWYFYLDGSMQLEVKLTGIMSTMAIDPAGDEPSHSNVIAPGLAAPHHQHLFCVRLDMDVDGPVNEVHEVDVVADPAGDSNPFGNAFRPHATRLDNERDAKRIVDPTRSRTWKIVNPNVRNSLGQPVAYKLVPGSTPTLLADPSSSVGRRAAFATCNLWVTPYEPSERRAAGPHPNQSTGEDGLPRFTAAERSLVDTDVVLWYTFGVTHVARPEDWPVMPVEYAGFQLVPFGFFDRNPALDVPAPAHCSSGGGTSDSSTSEGGSDGV
ncbi:MAG TPA: primary-amine oxidase [Acidimicrobiales bacterium]|nr:primary-amine oxidase [Acidimicrobiales bacterium]